MTVTVNDDMLLIRVNTVEGARYRQSKELGRLNSTVKRYKDENAKLREQVWRLQVDWESERDYADQMEIKEKMAVAENDKLRELVQRMRRYIAGAVEHCGYDVQTTGYTMLGSRLEECEDAMRELGVEVD